MGVIKIPSSNIYGIGDESFLKKNYVRKSILSTNKVQDVRDNILDSPYTVRIYDAVEQDDETYTFTFVGNNPSINPIRFPIIKIPNTSGGEETVQGRIILTPSKPFLFYIDKDNEDIGVYAFLTLKIICNYQEPSGRTQRKEILINKMPQYEEELEYETPLEYNEQTRNFERTTVLMSRTDSRVNGKYGDWYLTSAEFSIIGICYDASSVELSLGEAVQQEILTLPTNEIVRDNTLYSNDPLEESVSQNYANLIMTQVIGKYANGKEVHTIKCSIGKYYDINGNLTIYPENSSYPAVFEKYDIVEPYVFTSKGEVPLSTKADGTAKQFEVIGIDFSYKGVVWQELTIQEYVE